MEVCKGDRLHLLMEAVHAFVKSTESCELDFYGSRYGAQKLLNGPRSTKTLEYRGSVGLLYRDGKLLEQSFCDAGFSNSGSRR